MLYMDPDVSIMNMMFGGTELVTGSGVFDRSVDAANEDTG